MLGWRAIFLVNLPLGALALLLARRHLAEDRPAPNGGQAGFDLAGTFVLALTLAAYSLAMTIGRGSFGPLNLALLSAAICGAAVFGFVEARASSPLLRLTIFRDVALAGSLTMSLIVATVMMATLVVGPFFLSRSLELDAAAVGAVMSIGPIVSTLTGLPAGRVVDRFGAPLMAAVGLAVMALGAAALALLPGWLGVAGYIAALAILSPGYQLFQAANNTVVMTDVDSARRGVVSGMLSLSRDLGLITGASVMGAVFAIAAAATDIATAPADAVAFGMRITFALAATLIIVALALALATLRRAPRDDDGS